MEASILGIVFALILFIIIFSAVVLYLAFRIRETFRGEKRRGVLVVKIVFLIGILFLAAGGLYFLAQLFPSTPPPSDGNGGPRLNWSISYPTQVRISENFTISFVITNPTEYIAHGTVIQTSTFFQDFTVISSTHPLTGNVVTIGDVPKGTTVVSVDLTAPQRPGSFSYIITLNFAEEEQPIPQPISIRVTGAA